MGELCRSSYDPFHRNEVDQWQAKSTLRLTVVAVEARNFVFEVDRSWRLFYL